MLFYFIFCRFCVRSPIEYARHVCVHAACTRNASHFDVKYSFGVVFFRMALLLLQCVTIPAAFFYFLFHSVCFYALRLQLHLQTHTQQHCVGQSYFFLLLLEAKKYQELHSIFNYWQRKFLSNIFFCFSLCSAVVFFLTVCVRAKFN